MEQQQQQTEETGTEIALIEQDKSTVKILQEDDLKTLQDAVTKVKAFKKKYTVKKLTVTDITDKAQLEKLRLAIADVRTTKTGLEKDKKEKSKPYRDTVTYINTNYDKVIDSIELTILDPLKEYKKEVDEAIEAKAQEEQLRKEALLNERVDKVKSAGLKMDESSYYYIGSEEFNVSPISLGIIDLQSMTESSFEIVLAQIVEKAAIISEAQAKKDADDLKAKQEKEQKDKEEKEKFESDQKKLADEQKALEDERAEIRRNRIEARGEQLEMIGFVLNNTNQYILNPLALSIDKIADMPAPEWSSMITDIKLAIKEAKEKEEQDKKDKEAADKRKVMIDARYDQLFALGMKFNGQYGCYMYEDVNVDNATEICLFNEEEWTALIDKITPVIAERKAAAEQKAIDDKIASDKAIADKAVADAKAKEEQDALDKQAELLKQGDKAIWQDFISRLKAISFPDCKSIEYRKKVSEVNDFITDLK